MADETGPLVERGTTLKREIRAKQEALKEIEELLLERGPGTYEDGKGGLCTVVAEGTTLTVKADAQDAVKALAGKSFGKLFTVTSTWTPVKAFRDLAAALLSKPAARKLLGLVEVPRAGFVKWAK